MFYELKDTVSYKKYLFVICIITLISGIVFAFAGQIMLPVLTAFCSALLLFENPKKRLFSIAIPILIVAFNVVINGFYAIVSLEFVILSLLLSLLYHFGSSKAEVVVYMTFITGFFVLLYLYLYPYNTINSFNFEDVISYYKDIIGNFRNQFVYTISSLTVESQDGTVEALMTSEEADFIFSSLINSIIGVIGSLAFIISGLTLKLFCRIIEPRTRTGLSAGFQKFIPSNFISYFFIAVCVFNVFSNGETLLEISFANIGIILSVVYAYLGFKYVRKFAYFVNRRSMFWFLSLVAFLFATPTMIQLLSFVGVYFSLVSVNADKQSFNDK